MSNTPPALRGRPSHVYLAAREVRHQRRLEFQRAQAPLNQPVNHKDFDTNSTQTTLQNSSNDWTSSASSATSRLLQLRLLQLTFNYAANNSIRR